MHRVKLPIKVVLQAKQAAICPKPPKFSDVRPVYVKVYLEIGSPQDYLARGFVVTG
jgi:hypothetical protein